MHVEDSLEQDVLKGGLRRFQMLKKMGILFRPKKEYGSKTMKILNK